MDPPDEFEHLNLYVSLNTSHIYQILYTLFIINWLLLYCQWETKEVIIGDKVVMEESYINPEARALIRQGLAAKRLTWEFLGYLFINRKIFLSLIHYNLIYYVILPLKRLYGPISITWLDTYYCHDLCLSVSLLSTDWRNQPTMVSDNKSVDEQPHILLLFYHH